MHVHVATAAPSSHHSFNGRQLLPPRNAIHTRKKSHLDYVFDVDYHGPIRELVHTYAIVGQLRGLIDSLQEFPVEGRLDCQFTSRGHCDILGHMSLYNPTLESALNTTLQQIESVGRSVTTREGITNLTISFDTQIVEIGGKAV